jgi:hypothetical protein
MMDEPQCALCNEPISPGHPSSKLTQKGCDAIKRASEARGVDINTVPGQQVHPDCRKIHCNQKCIEAYQRKRACDSSLLSHPSHILRSAEAPFDYGKHCLFCGITDKYDGKKDEFKLIRVRTYDFQERITALCTKRNDDWANRVKARIDCVHDLHAADAVYHQACSSNFRTGMQIPQKFLPHDDTSAKRVKLGRPQDSVQKEAFMKVIGYLEHNDEEQTTINDLIQKWLTTSLTQIVNPMVSPI